MRLYSTLSRRLEELPAPPGPIRMYFCGPTVYQRIHVGNARPFVVSMWLRRWLRERGYDVTLVENITDINDKIYEAAPGASAALAARRVAVVRRGHLAARPGPSGRRADGDRVGAGDRRRDLGARLPRVRVRGGGRRVLPGRARSGIRAALAPASRPGRGAGAEPAQGGSARLRAVEGDEARGGHVLGVAVGAAGGRAGTSSAP